MVRDDPARDSAQAYVSLWGPPARTRRSERRSAFHELARRLRQLGHMSDARQSPIPQDRVNENIDQAGLAKASTEEQRQQERWLEDQGVDQRPGVSPEEQPGMPDEPAGPAEGGD